MMNKKKILFVDNSAHHLFGQMHLIEAFKNDYDIFALIPHDYLYFKKILECGIKCFAYSIDGKSLNVLKNFKIIIDIYKCCKLIQPDLICSFTIKPNIFSAIIAKKMRIPIIVNITGSGYVFMKNNLISYFAKGLYKFSFNKVNQIFFQNKDDYEFFYKNNLFNKKFSSVVILKGSGVDTNKFYYVGLAPKHEINFLFSGRLIKDKGLIELVTAFRKVKRLYSNINLLIMGNYYLSNPNCIYAKEIKSWEAEGIIKYLGMHFDVRPIVSEADCVILPSYKEGIPRSLLEASSMGKPIITVNSAGCKDVVEDRKTGLIAKVKDSEDLARAIIEFIKMPYEEKVVLGQNGRQKMMNEFEQNKIVSAYKNSIIKLI